MAQRSIMRLKDVSKVYRAGQIQVHALRGVSIEIERGELVFLIEAVILSLVGGAVGILVGAGISALVNLTGVFVAQLSLQSIVLAAGFSIAVGLFFGIFPAQRAARLNPIEALRYE